MQDVRVQLRRYGDLRHQQHVLPMARMDGCQVPHGVQLYSLGHVGPMFHYYIVFFESTD